MNLISANLTQKGDRKSIDRYVVGCISVTRGIGPTPTRLRVGGLTEGRDYSASIEIFGIAGVETGEVSAEVPFTMAPAEEAAPKIALGRPHVDKLNSMSGF